MKNEDNKNYGNIAVVSIATLVSSALIIYLLVKIFN